MKSIELFQWDLNKQIPCSFPEAHFACVGSKDALIVKANGGNASIPNVLLQEGKDIMFWFMESGAVADSGRIRIITRAKPADYVYTESEVITFESLVAKVESVVGEITGAVENATQAVTRAEVAVKQAEQATSTATAAADRLVKLEQDVNKAEESRKGSEIQRAQAEEARAASESKRTETFNTNLVSWNAKTDEAATKANKAAEVANQASGKVESALSQLQVGNVLKGEAESTLINLHDAWKSPILKGKVIGQSNQITTTGKNLFDWDAYIKNYEFDKTDNGAGFWFAKIFVGKGNSAAVSVDKIVTNGCYLICCNSIYSQASERVWLAHKSAAKKSGTLNADNEGYIWIGFNNSLANIQALYDTGVKVQVEIGTKATAYEPYTGGKPSPSLDYPQEITNLNKAEIVVSGKNLINVGAIQANGFNTRFNDAEILSQLNKLPRNIPLWFSCKVEPKGTNNGEIWFEGEGESSLGVMRQEKAYIVPEGEIKSFRLIGGVNDASSRTYSNIQIAAEKSDFANSDKAKHTTIDLKGNELCSLPNGTKDEVVIDAEGNVSLIKRTKQYSWHCQAIHDGTAKNYAVDKVDDIGANYSGLVADKAISATNGQIGTCYVNQRMIYVVVPPTVATTEQANQLYGGMKVIYQLAEPQTIPLGKVELPALPESTSNIWNNGNIPCDVYIQYLKDVNIAYKDLENQIKQITAALSMIDTPTIIPETAWGTPAAL